ncbi:hypothetical protein [Candidatus Ichthyocystis sparus]|nr:hypothetical protein [Candidatus Ichthyocystis sparus]
MARLLPNYKDRDLSELLILIACKLWLSVLIFLSFVHIHVIDFSLV